MSLNQCFTEGFFDAPNLSGQGAHRLHYLDYGSADATKTAFCLHGLTRNAHDFDRIASALSAQGYRVLALSMAGRGKSEWLADNMQYQYAVYMADCLAFLDNFHLRSVDWIGTSMGGIIGMMVAAMYPGRIRKLALNDVGSFIPASGLKEILTYVSKSQTRFDSRAQAEAQLRSNMQTFGIDSEADWQLVFEYSIEPAPEGGVRLAFDPEILAPARAETKDFTEVSDVDLSELWEAITIPVFILRGAQSTLLERETMQAMRASNPKAQAAEVEGVGHAPSLLKAKEYQPIVSWLGGQISGLL